MRRILIGIGIAIAVVIVGLLAATLLIDVNKYRPQIQAQIQKAVHRNVTLGNMGLKLFPVGARVDSLSISDDPAFQSQRPFATATDVAVSVGLFSLLRGEPELKSVTLNRPQVELIRNAAGQWNFGSMMRSDKSESSEFSLGSLKITDGQVAYTDAQHNVPRTIYDHIDVGLNGYAPNKRFGLDLDVHFPGTGKQLLSLKSEIGPIPEGAEATAIPVDGSVSLQEVTLSGFSRFAAGTLPPNTDGTVSGDATLTSDHDSVAAKGNLKLVGAVVKGSKVDYPVEATFDMSNNRRTDVLDIKSADLKFGSTPVSISGSIDSAKKPANADLKLNTKDASISELAKLAGMTGSGKLSLNVHVQGPISDTAKLNYTGTGSISGATVNAPSVLTKPVSIPSANLNFSQNSAAVTNLQMSVGSTSVKGNLSAKNLAAPQLSFQLAADKVNTAELQQLTAVPKKQQAAASTNEPSLLQKATGGGTLSAGTIVADDLVLTNVNTNVKLDRGVIALSPLTADLYGGKENGTVTLDTRPATALCSVNAKLNGVNTNALLGAISPVKDTLYGTLAATSNVSFALLPGNGLPKTLNGTLSFNVTNGELKRVNVLNEISRIAKFLNPGQAKTSGNSTALTKLGGTLNMRNGEATTNDLVAAIDGGSLSAKGAVSLVSQALNMDVTAVLSSGISQAVGGTGVGGFLNTALANNKGELVVPVKVSGTLQKPTFAPDAQAMAQMKMKNLLPTTGNPAAGVAGAILGGKGGSAGDVVKGILGGQRKPAQQGQQQQEQEQPQDGLKGLLKGLGKKKQ